MPDCAWCDATHTLGIIWTEMGVQYGVCLCCRQWTRIAADGRLVRIDKTPVDQPPALGPISPGVGKGGR